MCEEYIELHVHICVPAHRILVRIACAQKPPINSQTVGRVAQSVTCLATDACLAAEPGVQGSRVRSWSLTFVEIVHEIISTVILFPSADSIKKVVVSYKRKYVHELLVKRLFKPAQEKVWLDALTAPP